RNASARTPRSDGVVAEPAASKANRTAPPTKALALALATLKASRTGATRRNALLTAIPPVVASTTHAGGRTASAASTTPSTHPWARRWDRIRIVTRNWSATTTIAASVSTGSAGKLGWDSRRSTEQVTATRPPDTTKPSR